VSDSISDSVRNIHAQLTNSMSHELFIIFQNTNVDDGGFMNDLPLLKSKWLELLNVKKDSLRYLYSVYLFDENWRKRGWAWLKLSQLVVFFFQLDFQEFRLMLLCKIIYLVVMIFNVLFIISLQFCRMRYAKLIPIRKWFFDRKIGRIEIYSMDKLCVAPRKMHVIDKYVHRFEIVG
jgi:hypothetical protein